MSIIMRYKMYVLLWEQLGTMRNDNDEDKMY